VFVLEGEIGDSQRRYRLDVLGRFRFVDVAKNEAIALRSNARLLVALADHQAKGISRRTLIGMIWPEVDPLTAANRFRVALSKFRQSFAEALHENGDSISLNRSVVTTDIDEFLDLVDEAKSASNEEDELRDLVRATHFFVRESPEENCESWEFNLLQETLSVLHAVQVRVGEICLKRKQEETLIGLTGIWFALWPRDPFLWKLNLEAHRRLGRGKDAVRSLTMIKDRGLLRHPEVRETIRRILRDKVESRNDRQDMSPAESLLAADIVRTMIHMRPEAAMILLSSPETLPLAGAQPKVMSLLLERALGDTSCGDEHWERGLARLIALKAWLNDSDGVFQFGSRLIEVSKNPIILRAVWNAIALAHFLRREWNDAMAAISRAIYYAREAGSEIDLLSAQGNEALFLLHQGCYDDALARYNEVLGRLKEIGTSHADFEYVMGLGNRALIPVMRGDWPRALAWLEECLDLRTNGQHKVSMGSLLPALGMVRAMVEKPQGIAELFRQSFFEANETESIKSQQAAFEFAGYALTVVGHSSYGRSVVDWVHRWREAANMPLAPCEMELFQRICHSIPLELRLNRSQTAAVVGRDILRRLRACDI